MNFAIISLGILFTGLLLVSWRSKGRETTFASLKEGYRLMGRLIPVLLLAFMAAGFLEVAVPRELIQNWLGASSGFKGYLVGMVAGSMLSGGPYVTFPILGAIFRAGATVGTGVTFVTSWATLSMGLLLYEMAFVGPKFTIVRLVVMFWAPIVAGLLAQAFFG